MMYFVLFFLLLFKQAFAFDTIHNLKCKEPSATIQIFDAESNGKPVVPAKFAIISAKKSKYVLPDGTFGFSISISKDDSSFTDKKNSIQYMRCNNTGSILLLNSNP